MRSNMLSSANYYYISKLNNLFLFFKNNIHLLLALLFSAFASLWLFFLWFLSRIVRCLKHISSLLSGSNIIWFIIILMLSLLVGADAKDLFSNPLEFYYSLNENNVIQAESKKDGSIYSLNSQHKLLRIITHLVENSSSSSSTGGNIIILLKVFGSCIGIYLGLLIAVWGVPILVRKFAKSPRGQNFARKFPLFTKWVENTSRSIQGWFLNHPKFGLSIKEIFLLAFGAFLGSLYK